MKKIRLTSAQVTRLSEIMDRYYSGIASRGYNRHTAMEDAVMEIMEVLPSYLWTAGEGPQPGPATNTIPPSSKA